MKKKSTPKKKASTRKAVAVKKKNKTNKTYSGSGKSVAAKKKPIAKNALYVLAPGGYRLEHLVKKLPTSKKARSLLFNKLKKTPLSETAGKRFELINNRKTFLEGLEPADFNNLNPNWAAFAGFRNDTSTPIKKFTAKFVVPPAPQENTQVFYMFIGMENQQRILQPVLQWGFSKMGGGQFWTIGTCYAGGQTEEVIYKSELLSVLSGDKLTAVIELVDRTASGCRYKCFFEEFKTRTLLPTDEIPELKVSWVTLESYGLENRNEYPPSASILFTDINVIDNNNQIIRPPWNSPDRTGKYGEHATLIREPEQPDRINLFF